MICTPQTLAQTIDTARMYEATMEGAARRNRGQNRAPVYNSTSVKKVYSNFSPPTSFGNSNPHTLQPTRKLLSTTKMRARREKGLCYNCEEQFTPGHKCKQSHMFLLMTAEEESEYLTPDQNAFPIDEPPEQEVELSCHAMA